MGFPETRLRRLKQAKNIRDMLDLPWPSAKKFIWPVFCLPDTDGRVPIDSMPGQFRLGLEPLKYELEQAVQQGIGGVMIFGLVETSQKDPGGLVACREDGVVPQAIKMIKKHFPQLVVYTDVCLCAYTSHGHCGLINDKGAIDNDATLQTISRMALIHAQAGVDAVAPSGMMDGQVKTIRHRLDAEGFQDTLILSYSTKFASSLYGPFRDAGQSSPVTGDRQSHQQSFRAPVQAVRESLEDESECADILMVKPSLWYLDILDKIKSQSWLPVAAYNVSGEYSMLHAASQNGWGELPSMVQESLFALERAGADLIISYWARYYCDYFPKQGQRI